MVHLPWFIMLVFPHVLATSRMEMDTGMLGEAFHIYSSWKASNKTKEGGATSPTEDGVMG